MQEIPPPPKTILKALAPGPGQTGVHTPCHLNLATWQSISSANGPGQRYVLWLQGCRLRCPGCINPEMQPLAQRHYFSVEAVAESILGTTGIEGVTYTGGEPMLQAAPLATLSERLRPAGLSIVCFTGHTLEELQGSEDPWLARLLACVDVLIDGPYVPDEAASLLWRGSGNQRVHFLTDRYRDWASRVDCAPAQVEITVGGRFLRTSGIWPDGFLEDLEHALYDGDVPRQN